MIRPYGILSGLDSVGHVMGDESSHVPGRADTNPFELGAVGAPLAEQYDVFNLGASGALDRDYVRSR